MAEQTSPLPVRNGVNATRLRVPTTGPWVTVHEYVQQRFGHLDPAGITRRFTAGEVVDGAGRPLSPEDPLGSCSVIWYYRTLPDEPQLPVQEEILYEDEHLVVADKPHFLPTTPAGRYVQQTLLVRLRNRLNNPDLVPIHRLDRGTAGLVLLAKNPQTRGKYQLLFENRQVEKSYECISRLSPAASDLDPAAAAHARFPLVVRNRLEKTKGIVITQSVPYDVEDSGRRPHERRRAARGKRRTQAVPGANSSSRVELLETGKNHHGQLTGLFRLTPHTGKTHQLRVHMALLGLGIMHDRFYPVLEGDGPDDFGEPLQLLAKSLSFIDPLTGEERQFTSARKLVEAPNPH